MPTSEPSQAKMAHGPVHSLLDDRLRNQFRDLLELTGLVCESQDVAIHLLDETRQEFIAFTHDGAITRSPEACFCSHFIGQNCLLVPNLQEDARFQDHMLVTRDPRLRFYAGCPLLTDQNERIGSLCIRESTPRQLTPEQQRVLGALARQVVTQIQTTRRLIALEDALRANDSKLRDLTASDARFREFLDASPVSVCIKDEESRMLYCNKALADRYGATPEDWIGKTDYETWPIEIAEEFQRSDRAALEANREIHFEDRTLGPDGRTVIWDVHKYPFLDADGRRSMACMALDVTKAWEAQQEVQQMQQELRDANERLQTLSETDALTGLMNRRALDDNLEIECARTIRSGAPLSVFMLDLDDFKSFNDSFGHVCGDELLHRISVLIRKWIRKGDLAARFGGEEFLVILPATEESEAFEIAERVREVIAGADWKHRLITISGGVATRKGPVLTATEFIQRADEALYAAKRGGKNRICQARSRDSDSYE